MPTETDKLKIKLIQPTDMFADDTFNEVIKDLDNKLVGIAHLTSGAHWEVWAKNTDYAKGDIVRTPYLKSNQYLECTSAGKTGTDCPNDNIPGTMITDNTAKWVIRVLGAVDESTISIWIGGEEYRRGSLVLYNNKLYRCKVPHTATTFDADASKWQEVFASLQEWRATFYYALNDTVLYDGKLFKCILANDDAVFDINKWSLINNLSIVYPYEQNTNYMEGQLATVNGKLYRSKTTHLSPTGNFTADKINWENIYSDIVRWDNNVDYYVGDIVSFDDVMYICKIAHTSSSISFKLDKDNWNIYHTPSSFIKDWVANTIYESEQVVRYKKRIYRCKVKNDDSSWNESNWELINLDIEDWVASTNYYVGQYVSYNGTLYRCITANSDSTWTGSNWKKVSGGGIDNWVTGASYSVDDLVIYNNRIYQCITAHTSTTFSADEANWKEISSYTIHIDDWAASTTYKAGDLVAYDAQIYRCKVAHTSSSDFSTDDTKWEILSPTINIIKDWTASTAYTLGQFVTHNNVLYKCNTAHTSDSTSFDTDIAKWDKIGSSIDLWKSNTPYRINDLVIYADKLYSCSINHTSANAIDLSKWILIGDAGIKDWESSKAYKAGQLVLHGNVLYRIHDNHTSSAQISSDDDHLDFIWGTLRPWESDTYYKKDSTVYYGGCVYKCTKSHTSSSNIKLSTIYDGEGYIRCVRNGYSDRTVTEHVFDLGAVYELSSMDLHMTSTYGENINAINFFISTDGTDYTNAGSWTYKDGSGTQFTNSVTFKYSARYVKLVATGFRMWDSVNRDAHLSNLKIWKSTDNWELLSNVPAWFPNILYLKDDFCTYNGIIYKCLVENTDAIFTESHWIPVGGGLSQWKTNITYKAGDIVVYNDNIYMCSSDHTSTSTFDATKWARIGDAEIKDWVANTSYSKGDIIFKDGVAYRSKNDYTSAAQMSSEDSSLDFVFANVREWATSTYYRLGSIVKHNGALYECLVSHTSTTTFGNEEVYTGTSGIYNNSYPTSPGSSRSVYTIDIGKLANLYKISGKFVIDKHLWRDIKVEVSADNSAFTNVGTMHCNASGGSTVITMVFNSMVQGRYVKLTASNFSWWGDTPRSFSIDDLQIFALDDRWKLLSGYPQWQASTEYTTADIVTYGGDIYKCIKGNSDSTFDITKWKNITASDGGIGVWKALKYYAVDDTVIFGSKIYRCTVAHTSSTFDSDINKWTEVSPTTIENWQASTKYLVGNFVIKNDVLYECITANTDATFNSEKWKAISKDSLSAWESSKQYPLYATVVENEEVYFCIVAHTSSNTFKDDLDAHKWKLIGGGSSSGGNWEQVTKLNVVAPLNVDIPIPYTDTFNRPPVEVLKYTQGTTNITTNALTFNAGDGSKFEIGGVTAKDSQLITFDGVAKPNHDITYQFNTPTLMTSKYYSESEEIDLSDYKVVEEVSLE